LQEILAFRIIYMVKYSYLNIYAKRLFKQAIASYLKVKQGAAEIRDFHPPYKELEVIKLFNFDTISLEDKMEEFRDK